jgi:hypothetical protein
MGSTGARTHPLLLCGTLSSCVAWSCVVSCCVVLCRVVSCPVVPCRLVSYRIVYCVVHVQLLLRASWARDVSYIIGTALSPVQRKGHEEALLSFYLHSLTGHLRSRGHETASVPSMEVARTLYSQGMAWGLVIGWLICPPANYGVAIWSANVGRLVSACVDLGTFGLLGVPRRARG